MVRHSPVNLSSFHNCYYDVLVHVHSTRVISARDRPPLETIMDKGLQELGMVSDQKTEHKRCFADRTFASRRCWSTAGSEYLKLSDAILETGIE